MQAGFGEHNRSFPHNAGADEALPSHVVQFLYQGSREGAHSLLVRLTLAAIVALIVAEFACTGSILVSAMHLRLDFQQYRLQREVYQSCLNAIAPQMRCQSPVYNQAILRWATRTFQMAGGTLAFSLVLPLALGLLGARLTGSTRTGVTAALLATIASTFAGFALEGLLIAVWGPAAQQAVLNVAGVASAWTLDTTTLSPAIIQTATFYGALVLAMRVLVVATLGTLAAGLGAWAATRQHKRAWQTYRAQEQALAYASATVAQNYDDYLWGGSFSSDGATTTDAPRAGKYILPEPEMWMGVSCDDATEENTFAEARPLETSTARRRDQAL